jgi:hypothetical protein
MQIDMWMLYSDSSHFSEQLSYIKHFISSYGSKVINFTRFKHFLQFQHNPKRVELFSPSERNPHVTGGTEVADWTLTQHRLLKWRGWKLTGGAHLSDRKMDNKRLALFAKDRNRT